MRLIDSFGTEVDAMLAAMSDDSLDDGLGYARLRFNAISALLRRNYQLDDQAIGTLLQQSLGGDMFKALDKILFGIPDGEPEAEATEPTPADATATEE